MPPRPSSSSICSQCRHQLRRQARHQSTIATRTEKASAKPSEERRTWRPELPSFVKVPKPIQAPSYFPSKPVRGNLPTPRNIFGNAGQHTHRADPQYVERVAQEPLNQSEPHGPDAERVKYTREISAARRQSLKEGIREIWSRQSLRSDRAAKTSGLKVLHNRSHARAPPSLDETLTAQTLHPSARLLLATGNAPGPKPVAASKFPALLARRSEKRKEAIHNLYVNAQGFIVDNKQLEREIERVFGSDERPITWNGTSGVWGLSERPLTARDMLARERGGGEVDVAGQGRMTRIVETLTGGKMSEVEAEKL